MLSPFFRWCLAPELGVGPVIHQETQKEDEEECRTNNGEMEGGVGENYIKTDEFLNETSDLRSCVKVEVAVLGSCP